MSIINSARYELMKINWDPQEAGIMLSILERFLDTWDSGGAVSIAAPVLQRLIAGKPLSPLTGEEDEWADPIPGGDFFQNRRCSTVFKTKIPIPHHNLQIGDCYDLDNGGPKQKITFPYNPEKAEVRPPVMEIREKLVP
jgi:hypothetical protein